MQAVMAKFEGEMQLRLMNSAKFMDMMTIRRDAEGLEPVRPRKTDTSGNPVPDYERIREIEGLMTSKIGDSDAAEEAHEAMLAAKARHPDGNLLYATTRGRTAPLDHDEVLPAYVTAIAAEASGAAIVLVGPPPLPPLTFCQVQLSFPYPDRSQRSN